VGESFIQETLIVCEEFCAEMQDYLAQVFDELYRTLVEIDTFELKVAEEENGALQSCDLIKHQIMADLERISSDVKYDYPIELVTIQKTIAVIDLDSEPEIVGATAHMQVEAMQVDATADDDLIVID
jgi:hypothetical protein